MNKDYPYHRRVNYYETDQMGIVHHSNYIRWFEEARTDYMEKRGVCYAEIEKQGVLMPVVSVRCDYKNPARFADDIEIYTALIKFNGARVIFRYEVYSAAEKKLLVTGESEHCFIDTQSRKPLALRRVLPEYAALLEKIQENT